MSGYIETAEKLTMPVIALRGIVAFPGATINFDVTEDSFGSAQAAKLAAQGSLPVLLVSLRDPAAPDDGEPSITKLYRVGTVAKIRQLVKSGDGQSRAIAVGMTRGMITQLHPLEDTTYAEVMCKSYALKDNGGIRAEAYMRRALTSMERVVRHLPASSEEIMHAARAQRDPGVLADMIAANVLLRPEDKQTVLECFDPMVRIETVSLMLDHEAEILECDAMINSRVRERIARHQKEYYMREQIRTLQEELGEGDNEIYENRKRIAQAHLPEEIEKKLLKENDRLSRTPFGSAEANVLENYLDVCLSLPWNKTTKDRVNIAAAKKILDADHDGLEKVKERILEFMAVKQLSPELKNQIICLVGPPGVGKTSIAASIARAMKRKYVRVSLGGVRDEADIRGHRKTYIGAMPGRIIDAISRAGVRNPLILLDEIDKLSISAHGDPSSALLEVLDPEQNKFFRDHFVEMPFDLSDCLFIATANTLETVPRPLIDRMEIIELVTYTKNEKHSIAKNHLIPKQLKRHGLSGRTVKLTDAAIDELIEYYTREAGVRNLERAISDLCRKAAKKIVEQGCKRVTIDGCDIEGYLGPRKRLPDSIAPVDQIGEVNGLAWTEVGGDVLRVEVAVTDGTGKLELTGSLGDVMKESARAALTWVRSVAAEYGIPTDFYTKKDIHIHVPEGAVPKDGPSAGVTMATAMISALAGIPVKRTVAMTGEITLRGRVLAIGGLKEKSLAAYAAGADTVCIPADNLRDLWKIDPEVKENVRFIPCNRIEDVLAIALVQPTTAAASVEIKNDDIPEYIPVASSAQRTPATAFKEVK
ncbi:MAG: endopeptidase La [Ruminococcaceae bacterium]|nr:endopeptidase La [Oscillospiraceae bacterium]